MKNKTIKIKNLKAGVEEMKTAAIGHRFSIINSRDSENTEHRTEYEKINADEVRIVRHYEFS